MLDELTKILNLLHTSSINPAFLVQLFARLLHFIGASLFNGLVDKPVRVSPQWGRLLHDWIHKKLATWAEPQGLRVAVECYLTRLSQVGSDTVCQLMPNLACQSPAPVINHFENSVHFDVCRSTPSLRHHYENHCDHISPSRRVLLGHSAGFCSALP